MRQCGMIKSIDGDRAKIVMERKSACGDCKGCRWGEEDVSMEVEAINSINAKIGDYVEIDMEHQNVLFAAFIAYMIPLIALVAGVAIGSIVLDKIGLVQYKEVGAGIIGLVATGLSYLVIKTKESSFRANKSFVPIITGISNE